LPVQSSLPAGSVVIIRQPDPIDPSKTRPGVVTPSVFGGSGGGGVAGTNGQVQVNNSGTLGGRDASSASGKLVAATGSITAGHLAVFADTNGTIQDGGAPVTGGGGSGTPGGTNGQLQYNNGGAFAGVTLSSDFSLSGGVLSAVALDLGALTALGAPALTDLFFVRQGSNDYHATGTQVASLAFSAGGTFGAAVIPRMVAVPYAVTVVLTGTAQDYVIGATGNQTNGFTVTGLTGNLLLANPTGLVEGQEFNVWLPQDATGGRTISYGANWLALDGASNYTLQTAANALDLLVCKYALGKIRYRGCRAS
jgi:hypothetical protein